MTPTIYILTILAAPATLLISICILFILYVLLHTIMLLCRSHNAPK